MDLPGGYTIKIYVPSGDPNALKTIEKTNWSGAGLMAPRNVFPEVRERPEVRRAGVYVLLSPPGESGLPRVYVGEGDPVGPRLDTHSKSKDFWTSLVVFSSDRLNKAHVQHLESRLVQLADKTKLCVLDNGTAPTRPTLSESEVATAEGFLAEMLLCFPVLGIGVFGSTDVPVRAPTVVKRVAQAADYTLRAKNVEAHGSETSRGFLVMKGGTAASREVPSILVHLRALRRQLKKSGVLRAEGDTLVLTQDYVFSSPSNAAGVMLGRSANGRTEWKTSDGRTLKDVQESGS